MGCGLNTPDDRAAIDIAPGRAIVGRAIALSFQRYPEPAEATLTDVPQSFGALTCASPAAGEIIVAVRSGEAVWIGVEPEGTAAALELDAAFEVVCGTSGHPSQGEPQARWQTVLTAAQTIDGMPWGPGGLMPFVREPQLASHVACTGFHLTIRGNSACRAPMRAHVMFVSPERFAAVAGSDPPEPLDLSAGYDGSLLP